MNKLCSTCKIDKPLSEFNKDSRSKDGYRYNCKTCRTLLETSYKEQSKKTTKIWKENNKDHVAHYMKEWRFLNKSHILEYEKKYRVKYLKNRRKNDLQFRLATNLRQRLRSAIKQQKISKIDSFKKNLGCNTVFLKNYIESLWKPGMNWDNYGKKHGQWSIDHIVPLAFFDLSNKIDFSYACHYYNLRPLWVHEHILKTKKDMKVIKFLRTYRYKNG